jgi:hypothetical protein
MVNGSALTLQREGRARSDWMFWRPESDERRLLNLNDFYGAGVLAGVTGTPFPRTQVNWFCGKLAAEASYYQGLIDGREIRHQSEEIPDAAA